MFYRNFVVLLLVCGFVGCASVPMGDPKRDVELKSFTPKAGVAGLYIYRNAASAGEWIKFDVEVDGKPVGRSASGTFLYKEVTPGQHTVTSKSENVSTLEIDTVAGKLYYIWLEATMGDWYSRSKLHLVLEDGGKAGVLATQFAETK